MMLAESKIFAREVNSALTTDLLLCGSSPRFKSQSGLAAQPGSEAAAINIQMLDCDSDGRLRLFLSATREIRDLCFPRIAPESSSRQLRAACQRVSAMTSGRDDGAGQCVIEAANSEVVASCA